jgi:hypothetical protein
MRRRVLEVSLCVVALAIAVGSWFWIDANAAGWITTGALTVVIGFVTFETDFPEAFSRWPKQRQWIAIAFAFALTVAGGAIYVVFPGGVSWWLCGLPGIPLVLLVLWLAEDSESQPGSGTGGFGGDGPWTAP